MNKAYIAGPWALTEAAGVTETRALECNSTARDATSGETPAPTRGEEISRLCREHNRALINFLLTRVRNEQEAKDVAQETYMRLLQLDRPVEVGCLRWYLFKIARNIAADHHRRSRIRARLSEFDTAGAGSADVSAGKGLTVVSHAKQPSRKRVPFHAIDHLSR